MKLSEYAKAQGISYMTAWRWWKAGTLNGVQQPSGTILIVPEETKTLKTVIYTRVSSSQNKSNLETQAERLVSFCNKNGWQVDRIVKEIGSGVNDNRKNLTKILADNTTPIRLVVEHKDRLTRFGFNYIQLLVENNGGEIVVVNPPMTDTEDLIADLLAIVYSFTARLYSKRRAKHVKGVVKDAIS